MPAEPTLVRASVGACPYCGCTGCSDATVLRQHPTKAVVSCTTCGRYSTRGLNARRYPHDDPSDPNSSYALRVRVEL